MDYPSLVNGAIDPETISGILRTSQEDTGAGAHSLFLGQVRADMADKREVRAIEYSAYKEMVDSEADRIRKVTTDAFPDIRDIVIVHSTGIVKAGEVSLLVIVTAGHRDQATRGCRHVLELIKSSYPVWKKELFDDDSSRWAENH
ncbi:MAG: molybdenum cofactor biosynthesis protein MoaE [Bacteroidales bacterium]|nr:molybdenum cofactor biosynthesis protein MoaE [Bacteroidales bacterium]